MFLTPLNSSDEHIHSIATSKAADEALFNIVNFLALLKCYSKFVYFTVLSQISNGNLVKLVKLLFVYTKQWDNTWSS
jgi:hypothetical protein